MGASIPQLIFLSSVGLIAGLVDAMAGGGGLLTVPALLAVGLPPHLALGTNKGQSVFGSGAAIVRYGRHGWISWSRALWAFPAGFLGSLGGSTLQLHISSKPLRPLVLALLIGAAVFVALRPSAPAVREGQVPGPWRERAWIVVALIIGFYDGFFGPGTGTFLIIAQSIILFLPLAQASAQAKVVNFASNLAALGIFAAHGTVLWRISLPMAGGQLLGGFLGAHLTVGGGDRWVRRAVLVVVALLVVKVSHDLWGSF